MLNTIDTVIAFAVIMTVLSLLITIAVQMASAALSLRGKNLANALALTFQTIDPSIGKYAHSLAAQILRDPQRLIENAPNDDTVAPAANAVERIPSRFSGWSAFSVRARHRNSTQSSDSCSYLRAAISRLSEKTVQQCTVSF